MSAAVRVRWPTRTDLVHTSRALDTAQGHHSALHCHICAEFMYEPVSCTKCSATVCLVCFYLLSERPQCPQCRGHSWMRNIAVRDALLSTPAHRVAYMARHDGLAANPLLVITASVRHVIGDAHLRWSPGLHTEQAFSMFSAALSALRLHSDDAAARPATTPATRTTAAANGLIVTRMPGAAAAAADGHASLVYECTSEWGNWVEFQSPTLGYAICARSDRVKPCAAS